MKKKILSLFLIFFLVSSSLSLADAMPTSFDENIDKQNLNDKPQTTDKKIPATQSGNHYKITLTESVGVTDDQPSDEQNKN